MEADANEITPLFSVIVPTFNRPAALRACLAALGRQSAAVPFEVIVVNDGGSPVANLPPEISRVPRFRVLEQPNSGPGAARNFGYRHADGAFLAFTDDDCEPEPDWLKELAVSLQSDPSALVGGRVVNALTEDACAAASQLLLDFLYEYARSDGAPQFFTSNNIALARQPFEDSGGFDEAFALPAAEDRELCARWRRSRRNVRYAPAALIRHSHHLTLGGFVSQHFRYGRGACQLRAKAASLGWPASRIGPPAFYWNLLCYPFRAGQGNLMHRCQLAVLLVLSQIAHTAGFFRQWCWPSRVSRRQAVRADHPARE